MLGLTELAEQATAALMMLGHGWVGGSSAEWHTRSKEGLDELLGAALRDLTAVAVSPSEGRSCSPPAGPARYSPFWMARLRRLARARGA